MSEEIPNNEKVRYGKDWNSQPKNTLYTIRKEGKIYFGVSRTNIIAGDRFNKQRGKQIAKGRAEFAIEDPAELVQEEYELIDGVYMHNNGMRGFTPIDNVKSLLSYFDNIDYIHAEREYSE